ncbi:hypothetical protein [Paracoccus endophyticus]|uniref:hypothetical protein n=1 Tax=Paracoccus endophyticus TaxID=2233774 RepID=UPI000DDB233B|nr:hypothetical protein [Paracoccus endophyticus]
MAARPVTIPKNELAGYAQVMREANIEHWTVSAERPDGTRITITAGATTSGPNEIDKMLGIGR